MPARPLERRRCQVGVSVDADRTGQMTAREDIARMATGYPTDVGDQEIVRGTGGEGGKLSSQPAPLDEHAGQRHVGRIPAGSSTPTSSRAWIGPQPDGTVSSSGGVPAPRIVGLVDTPASRAGRVVASSTGETSTVTSYVPRLLLRHLADEPERRTWTVDGTVVFVDISGFTKLSERLAKHGKEGAEQVTEAIETCFTDLLAVAYANGGGLIKFGGDALLLLFQGEGQRRWPAVQRSGSRSPPPAPGSRRPPPR